MRVVGALAVLMAVSFAGCAEQVIVEPQDDGASFEDFDVDVDEQTGVILGVVVDQSITPVQGAQVVLTSEGITTETDDQGRFAFDKLEPGTYFFEVGRWGFSSTQASAQVEAGVANPPVVKVQIERLYNQEPYLEVLQFNGYFSCAIAVGISTTCVNDYTRLDVTGLVCPGGCFGDEIRGLGIDTREYIHNLTKDWHSYNLEWWWEPSLAGTSNSMGVTISFYARIGASHRYGGGSGESPMLVRLDMQEGGEHPAQIPPEGKDDLFVFFSTGSGNVALEQEWETFQHVSFYAPLPDGWSFLKGDENPFGN